MKSSSVRNLQRSCYGYNSRRNHDECSHHRSTLFQCARWALRRSHLYRRDAGQLWRITRDRAVESEFVHHCDSKLSEDGDGGFDCYWMLARHMGPVGTKSVHRAIWSPDITSSSNDRDGKPYQPMKQRAASSRSREASARTKTRVDSISCTRAIRSCCCARCRADIAMTHAQRAGRSRCSSLALPGRLRYGKNFALYLPKRMKVSSASVGEMSSDWSWVDS